MDTIDKLYFQLLKSTFETIRKINNSINDLIVKIEKNQEKIRKYQEKLLIENSLNEIEQDIERLRELDDLMIKIYRHKKKIEPLI